MARCKHIFRMGAFYDGQLAEEEQRRLQDHVAVCRDCAAEIEQLEALSRLLARAEAPRLSPAALERMHQAVGNMGERVVFGTARAFAMAAAALLAVCAVWLWQGDGGPDAYAAEAPEWERAAVFQQAAIGGDLSVEAQLAQWIVEDLERENGSE